VFLEQYFLQIGKLSYKFLTTEFLLVNTSNINNSRAVFFTVRNKNWQALPANFPCVKYKHFYSAFCAVCFTLRKKPSKLLPSEFLRLNICAANFLALLNLLKGKV
jgi:hypothetical protein